MDAAFKLTAAASSSSRPVIACNKIALSITLRVIGPGVSSVLDMGMIPPRDNKPIVGFRPTTEFELDGESIEPLVSEPTAATAKLAAIATPLPELEPPVSCIFLP